ncbi:hypothetical protein BCON_0208g00100 [Botryotinia convoluta]|uniref:Uncharacterized protein n=1 Tax=Botryotinia convoluta TaxID=54673 RepID=A0A4Z1HXL2_9HELO|nr:hypothetical protein BCON_0208g00100 [Botryotinia convoluta]
MAKNFRPNPSKGEPQNPHYHPQYNWHPHWALDTQSKTIATSQYNKTWNSRHSHLARQYPDAPAYGAFLIYITDKFLWRENMRRAYGSEFAETMRFPGRYRGPWYRRRVCTGGLCGECEQCGCYCRCWVGSECSERQRKGECLYVEGMKSRESCCSRVGRSVGKESDVELGVDEGIIDPDIPIPSIETDGETCSPRMNIGTGKVDTIKLGELVLDPDIPIPSIERDADDSRDKEESEGRLVELQNGKDERRLIEEESQ